MTKNEVSQLLYLETCCVDQHGRVNMLKCNDDDRVIMDRWNESGYIEYGRIKLDDSNRDGSSWVRLSEKAWTDAHRFRRERAECGWKNKTYETTGERKIRRAKEQKGK